MEYLLFWLLTRHNLDLSCPDEVTEAVVTPGSVPGPLPGARKVLPPQGCSGHGLPMEFIPWNEAQLEKKTPPKSILCSHKSIVNLLQSVG